MLVGLSVILTSFCFTLVVFIIYSSKEKIGTIETKLYEVLISLNIVGLILETFCCFSVKYRELSPFLSIYNIIVNKLFLMYFISWPITFLLYVLYISYINDEKANKLYLDKKNTFKFLVLLLYIVANSIVLALPLYFYSDSKYTYSYGPATNAIVVLVILVIIISFYSLFKNYKDVKKKKYFPLFVLVVLLIIACIIRNINPGLIIINSGFAFVTVIMYFTIENPDIKMLNEVYKNKELMEQTYEDKSNFLFEMTQEVRDPLYNLTNICNLIKEENDINKIKENVNAISNSVRQLDFIVNNVLNISTLDVQRVKIVESRYSLKTLFDDIVSKVKVKDKVEFRTSIPNNVPYLYGDSIKLKQVLYSLIMNSVNKTIDGFIEFKIDIIEKYDVARVIFSIVDSGVGMSIDKVNEILSTTGEFDTLDLKMLEKTEFNIQLCQKIIKALGGNLLIKSKLGKGTEVILTIDQRIYNNEKTDNLINSYENRMYRKKVLVVCQDKNITESLKQELIKNDISASYILYGMDAVDKIKSGKKYDFIIVQDDMKEMSGYETLKTLMKEKKFNIPVIVMLEKNKETIKEHFLTDGFEDYILLDDFSNEIKRIISKY